MSWYVVINVDLLGICPAMWKSWFLIIFYWRATIIVQGAARGLGQSQAQIEAGWQKDWEQLWLEGLGGAAGWKTGHAPVLCVSSPETDWVLGCIQRGVGSQGRVGICPIPLPWWQRSTWRAMNSFGDHNMRRIWPSWSDPRGGTQRRSKGWSSSATGCGQGLLSLEKRRVWGELGAPSSV